MSTLVLRCGLRGAQYLTDANGNGNYGFVVAIPANVINIFGGVLSANQVPARTTDCHHRPCLCTNAADCNAHNITPHLEAFYLDRHNVCSPCLQLGQRLTLASLTVRRSTPSTTTK